MVIQSLNSIAYSLAEMYRANLKTTSDIDIRLFKNFVKQTRAQLLKQRFDANIGYIDSSLIQDLGPVAFASVDSSVDLNIPSGKYLMRSVNKIPLTISRNNSLGTFTHIGPSDFREAKWNLVTKERAVVSGNGKFNQNSVYVFLTEDYLYLLSKTNLEKYITKVNVRGVFVDPEQAYTFNINNASVPWTDDLYYPINSSIISDLENMILSTKFKFIMTQFDDKLSNGTDNTTTTNNVKK